VIGPTEGHLSSFTLDALALDALSDDDLVQIKEHLAGCAACRARWKEECDVSEGFRTPVPTKGPYDRWRR
jgi:hypothetical protein